MFRIKNIVLPIACCLLSVSSFAQKDTTKKTTIDITSSYKPVLRNAVKINFSASHAPSDTVLPVLQYTIPAQNLVYSYQPIPLQPLALEQDSNLYLGIRNFVKLGFGNFTTPYVNAGFSFGDGKKTLLNAYASYIASKGKIKNQDYSKLNIKATGSYFTATNEVYGGASVSLNDNYLYGYNHSIYDFKKKDIQQQFMDVDLRVGFRNTTTGAYGINYNPSLWVSNFTSKDKLNETSVILTAPVEKQFGEVFTFKAEAKADITRYTTKNLLPGNVSLSNNVIQLAPSLVYSTPKLSINGGIIPTWDNGKFIWLPNVYAEAQILQNAIMFQAGWVGRYTKNTYRNLSAINPYLSPITTQKNTKEVEYYGGIKTTLAKHFNLNAKVGLIHYTNLPFFINDTSLVTDSKNFVISNESSVNNLKVHGDISYINREKLTATAGITLNGYTLMKDNTRAWNTLPLEFNASIRWWAFKQVLLKADFYAFGSSYYLVKGNAAILFRPGSDLSAGIEFKVNKMFSAWLDVNNIFSDKYQRWHNYEVYGLNLLGGVKVSF